MTTFNKVILCFCIVTFVCARRNLNELLDYSFEEYLRDYPQFHLQESSKEYLLKKNIFLAELTRVREHNAKNLSWKESINQFSILSPEEKQVLFGRSKGAHKKTENLKYINKFDTDKLNKPLSELPSSIDWRDSSIATAVKDQGFCGSCWAFASTATLESHVALSTGALFDLSVQQFTSCAPNPDACGGTGGCQGSTAELAYEYLAGSSGIVQEFQYGYSAYYGTTGECSSAKSSSPVATISGYVQLPGNNYTALMNSVATIGPIAINVDASSWSAYDSGIYDGCDQSSPDVDHVVVLMGYGEENNQKYWLVRNSWSPTWGEQGYIRLARDDKDEENCGEDVTPQDGVACADEPGPVKVCGTCGVIYDSVYPIGAALA